MTRIKLDYIHEFRDRHGKVRRYFRRPGYKRIRLPGLPGSDEFMSAYQLALAGHERVEIGANRTKPGTVNAAIVGYYNSDAFCSLAPETKKRRRNILEHFRAEHGDKRIVTLPAAFIIKTLGKKSPAAARNWFKALRGLLQFAVANQYRRDDPTEGMKLARSVKSEGFHAWTEVEIEQFKAHHPIGSRARLALALLLFTAQRRGDVVRIGRQHVRNGVLSVRQDKTGTSLDIPILPELQAAIEAHASDHLTFLVTDQGKPFTSGAFGHWFRDRCREAGLPKHCSAHGLRKAACRRLAEAGCTAHQIAAISGHMSLSEVQRYTKSADQARLAREAMRTVQGAFPPATTRTSSGKPE